MKPVSLNRNFILIDFETTGLHPSDSRPIQVGVLVMNPNFEVIDEFSSYIVWSSFLSRDVKEWNRREVGAYNVHRIPFKKVLEEGSTPLDIVRKLALIGEQFMYEDNKPVLISDNALFDGSFLDDMMHTFDFQYRDYFHYAIWDTGMLCNLALQKNPNLFKGIEAAHESLADCRAVREMLIRAKGVF